MHTGYALPHSARWFQIEGTETLLVGIGCLLLTKSLDSLDGIWKQGAITEQGSGSPES